MTSPDLLRPPTVLVVDDEPAILALLAEVLGRAGFVVVTAGGGEEAVAAYRRGRIDLVLLDVRMAPWNGPWTLCELRRLDPRVRAAFMSGDAGGYTADDLLALGALRVFAKPFGSSDGLVAALRELIPTARRTG